jgi:hypothetical protein
MGVAVWSNFRVTKHRFIHLTRNQRHRQRQLPVVLLHMDEATVALLLTGQRVCGLCAAGSQVGAASLTV